MIQVAWGQQVDQRLEILSGWHAPLQSSISPHSTGQLGEELPGLVAATGFQSGQDCGRLLPLAIPQTNLVDQPATLFFLQLDCRGHFQFGNREVARFFDVDDLDLTGRQIESIELAHRIANLRLYVLAASGHESDDQKWGQGMDSHLRNYSTRPCARPR